MTDTVTPRFGLPDVDFLEIDTAAVQSAVIREYENLSGRKLAQADPMRLVLLSLAAAVIELRGAFNLGARQNLLTYATGAYLDHLGEYVLTPRLQASGAQTTLLWTLVEPLESVYIIPAGTKVTNGSIVFATIDAAQIAIGETQAMTVAVCQTPGSAGNGLGIGELTTMVDPMPEMASVTNVDITSGGADVEDDESYAERIRLAPDAFSVAGPQGAYIYHAMSYDSSLIDVAVYGLQDQPGYVFIHPLLDGGVIPNETFLEGLKAHLNDEDIRPITDCLVVTAPKAVNYEISLTWYITTDDIDRQAQITQAVQRVTEEYRLWQQQKIGRDIVPDHLVELLRQAGVKRVEITTPVYTVVQADEVAQCGPADVNLVFGGAEEA